MTADKRSPRPTRARHVVLALTVVVYMITYIDRVVISAAVPSMQAEFGFSLATMGWILAAFQLGYALFQIPGGWFGDRFGPRRALAGVVVWWSAFTAATTLAWSGGSMIAIRFLFGMGEAGAFPIATRSLSRWMLPSERGWAQGLTHAGSRLGGAVTPVMVVALIAQFGWRAPFLLFAGVGLLWAALWVWYYRDEPAQHRFVNAAEEQLIRQALGRGEAGARKAVPWRAILTSRQMWLLAAMYACYGYSMGIYLSWFPKYLVDAHGFSLAKMGFYASLPLIAGVAGDVTGGWVSDLLLKLSGNLKMARRLVAVVGFLLASVSILMAVTQPQPMVGVVFFCLAVFGLELTVGVSWAVALDVGEEHAGSVSSVMNTAGNLGGTTASAATGYLVTAYGWNVAFGVLVVLCALAALLFLWIDASRPIDAPKADAAPLAARPSAGEVVHSASGR
jgi:sugar phosphate permease